MWAITGGGGKDDTCDHGLYVQKLESRSVPKKENFTRRDDQSAISSKEQVKYEATQSYLSVTYQHHRLHLTGKRLQQRSQGPLQQQSAPPIFLFFGRVFSGKKNIQKTMRHRDECMPLTGFFRGDCLLTTTFA